MTATLRSVLAAVLLIGFYLLALVQLITVVVVGGWVAGYLPGALALTVFWPLLAAAGGTVAVASWRAIRGQPEPPDGLPVPPVAAPHLWDMVRQLAAEIDTRAPDEIRIVPDVNAAVVEETRLLGLVAGRRCLYLGVPLLQGLTVAQLRAVVAHELGHYSGRHTRLGMLAYRGHKVISGTIDRIGRRNPVGWAFRCYARLYLLVDRAVVRRQELAADRVAVWVAGRAAAASALREVPVLAAAWRFYFARYVQPGWELGYAPDDLFGGLRHLLAERQAELESLRLTVPGGEPSRWDTHPPLAERLAAISEAPVRSVTVDDRPAEVLLTGLDSLCRDLQAALVDTGGRTVLPWSRLASVTTDAATERTAGDVLAVLARITGGAPPASLATLLDVLADGRISELAQPLFPAATRREQAELLTPRIAAVLTLAALRAGVGQWRHSWSSPPELVEVGDGMPIDLVGIARLAVEPETVARARRRLTALGLDLTTPLTTTTVAPGHGAAPSGSAAPDRTTARDGHPEPEPDRRTARGGNPAPDRTVVPGGAILATSPTGEILGGMADIKVDDVRHDLLILDIGLVLIADPDTAELGRERLNRLVRQASVSELTRRYWFIRSDEIAHARIRRTIPVHAELDLVNGRQVALVQRWTSAQLNKKSDEILVRILTTGPDGGPRRRPVPSAPSGPWPGASRDSGPDTPRQPGPDARPGPMPAPRRDPAGPAADLVSARVLDGLANIKVDKVEQDLLVLDVGLVLVPEPGQVEKGRERLQALVASGSAAELAQWYQLIRYEEIVGARINREIPLRAELELWDGRRIALHEPWTTQQLTNQSRRVLTDALRSVGAGTR